MNDAGLLAGISYDSLPGRIADADRQAAQDRLAATLVRKRVMKHNPDCWGKCRHRNCARDRRHLLLLLEALNLANEPARPGDYETRLVWHAISRSEANVLAGKPVIR